MEDSKLPTANPPKPRPPEQDIDDFIFSHDVPPKTSDR